MSLYYNPGAFTKLSYGSQPVPSMQATLDAPHPFVMAQPVRKPAAPASSPRPVSTPSTGVAGRGPQDLTVAYYDRNGVGYMSNGLTIAENSLQQNLGLGAPIYAAYPNTALSSPSMRVPVTKSTTVAPTNPTAPKASLITIGGGGGIGRMVSK